jgi:quercetin dioxygenase-like cupin family protein
MPGLTITTPETAPKVPFKLDGRIMFASEKLELIHLTLQPGEKMDIHAQPIDVVFYVISGSGILDLEGDSFFGSPGTCIHVPAGMQRGWKNNTKEEFRVLVVKDLK